MVKQCLLLGTSGPDVPLTHPEQAIQPLPVFSPVK